MVMGNSFRVSAMKVQSVEVCYLVLEIYVSFFRFIVSAVSPAVVVPNLISLQKRGYGEDKGICTLVIAASSIDDIICISGFGVMLGMVLSQGKSRR